MRNKKHRFSTFASVLSRNIIWRTALVFSVAFIIVTTVSIVSVHNQSSKNALIQLNNSRLEIEKVLSQVESAAHAFKLSLPDMIGNDEFIEKTATDAVKSDGKILSCCVAYEPFLHTPSEEFYMILATKDSTGIVTTSVVKDDELDYFYENWYMDAKSSGQSMWNEPSYALAGGSVVTVSYSTPLYDLDGIFIGVLRMDLDIDWLSSVATKYKPYASSQTMIVSSKANYIVDGTKAVKLNSSLVQDFEKTGKAGYLDKCNEIMTGAGGSMTYYTDRKQKYLVYSPMDSGWIIIGICNYRDLFSIVTQVILILLAVASVGLFILYFSSKRVINSLTKSITELSYSAMNMSRGNFHANIPISDSAGEIKQLEISMHYLQNTINDYFSLLKNATAKQERIDSELAIANSIQQSFLPRTFTKVEGYECYGTIIPAKEVGGDLFDVRQEGRNLYFAVGDVSGKGIPAALFMAITKSAFNFFKGKNSSTREIVTTINNVFSEGNPDGMFVTLFAAKVNLDTMVMEYCNGGHNPVILISPDGKSQYIKAKPNLAVGLFPDFPYEEETIQIQKGCRILAYTDGVSEAENIKKDLFGDARLLDYAKGIGHDVPSKDVVDNLLGQIRTFTDGNEQNDDITIFSVIFE